MKRPLGAVGLTVSILAAALTASGCATNLSGSGLPTTGSSSSLAPIEANQALFAKLPPQVRSSKQIVVGTSPTYKPMEFLEGGKVSGLDVELFEAAAQRMGVGVKWEQSPFDQILIGLQAKKYDVGVSSFSITPEREKTVNMVSYLSAGSLWVTQKGNPKGVVQGKPCGLTISVQTGVVQEQELKAAQAGCGADKINVLSYGDQGEATAALISGRAQVMAADSPIALYAVKMSGDKLEALGKSYDTAPYGVVVPKAQTEFAQAIAQAFTELKADGHYDAVLQRWNQAEGGTQTFEVNP